MEREREREREIEMWRDREIDFFPHSHSSSSAYSLQITERTLRPFPWPRDPSVFLGYAWSLRGNLIG